MSTKGKRLGDGVLKRRAELDLTQLDVWQAGGPSNTTLTKIEKGEADTLPRTTARKLDEGLRWVKGSAKALFDHGTEPLPLPDDIQGLARADVRRLAEAIRAAAIDESTRDELLQVLDRREGA